MFTHALFSSTQSTVLRVVVASIGLKQNLVKNVCGLTRQCLHRIACFSDTSEIQGVMCTQSTARGKVTHSKGLIRKRY